MARVMRLIGIAALTAVCVSQAVAQQAAASLPLGNAAMARARSARFLASRGVASVTGLRPRLKQSPARLLASTRAGQAPLIAVSASSSGTGSALWQPVGPAQVITSAWGAVAGQVTSVAVDSSDATGGTVYVGTAFGGVWRSTTASSSNLSSIQFTELTDAAYSSLAQTANAPSLSIGAVSVEPAWLLAPGAQAVVLAGTGVANDTTASYFGDGILRSVDGGADWSLIPHSSDETTGGANTNFQFAGNGFAGFAWGGTATNPVVVAAVSQSAEGVELGTVDTGGGQSVLGIYYSLDLGQTWLMATITDGAGSVVQSDQTNFLSCAANLSAVPCGNAVTAVVWNPVRKMFYAAVRFHGYYGSADGITWTRLANQPGVNLTTGICPSYQGVPGTPGSQACPIYNGALAVQPVTGDTFALTTDINDADQGLWQDACGLSGGACASSTLSFTQIGDAALDTGGVIPQADYDLWLAAVPYQNGSTADTLLFAGTADIYRCDLGTGCAWRNTTNTESSGCENSAQVAPAQFAVDATFGASGLLYFGNAGGLWRSTNGVSQPGAPCSPSDAQGFENLNGAFQGSIATVEDLAVDPAEAQNLMVSLGPLGTASPLTGTTAWQQVLGAEGDHAAIDPVVDANWYATSEPGIGINHCATGPDCGGAFGLPVIVSGDVGNDGYGQLIPAPWILDPQNTADMIVGTCRIWRGPAAGGVDFNLLSTMLDGLIGSYCSGNAEIRSLAASGSATDAPGTPETIYAGMAGLFDGGFTAAGHVFAKSVGNNPVAALWTDLSLNLNNFNPDGFDISDIYVDPYQPGGQTVYVTVQGFGSIHVYQSADGGSDWQNISSNLPDAPANAVVVDPTNDSTVYVATDAGVYFTQNVASCGQVNSKCWSLFGSSLPNVPVVKLVTAETGSGYALFAATYGRGVWQTALSGTAATTKVTVAPTSLIFASTLVDTTSAAQQVLVTNTGSLPFVTGSITMTGDFTESDTCVGQSIAPGHACIVEVTFAPSATGSRTGTLTLHANVANGGVVVVSLNGTGAPGAAVTLTPTVLCFATTLIGQTSSTSCQGGAVPGQAQAGQSIVIANTGGVAAALASVSVSGDFKVISPACGKSLAAANTAGDSCTVSVVFTPTASGTRTGVLTVVDSTGTQTAELTGAGESGANVSFSATSLNLGSSTIGVTPYPAQTVVLTNSGDEAADITSVTTSAVSPSMPDDYTAAGCGTTLAGHGSCTITVTFDPTTVGSDPGTLTVGYTVQTGTATATAYQQQVSLVGVGVAPPGKVSIEPAPKDFGTYTVGISSKPVTFTVSNKGLAALTSMQISVSGANGGTDDFTIVTNTCGSSLAPNQSCTLGVIFTPSTTGLRNGTLTLTATGLSAPVLDALSGTGAASVTPFSMAVSGQSTQTVVNGQPVTFTINVNGPAGMVTLASVFSPAGSNADFAIPSSVTLNGLNSSSFNVTFTPPASPQTARTERGDWARAGLALAMLLPVGFMGCRRRRWRVLAACVVLALMVPVGCGVASSAGSGPSSGGGGTTPVSTTYLVTVTGTLGNAAIPVNLQVNVE